MNSIHSHANANGIGYASVAEMQKDTAVSRQLEIPYELDKMERNLKGIAQGLDTLEDRLQTTILRHQAETKVQGQNAPVAVPSTPMARTLNEFNAALAFQNERLQSLLARLEA